MCGFTGYYYLDQRRESSNAPIREMLKLQHHRGPDDSGITLINTLLGDFEHLPILENVQSRVEANLVFGFNRLSILDLSANGHQPMESPDSSVILMMNGEVYNAFDFKDELLAKGHVFKGSSDTEMVLHMYLEFGMQGMIERLNGMFALAIFDRNNHLLHLARDRFGIKPLYILQEEGRLAFASELKSFKALPDFRFEADYTHLDEFLLFRNLINRTLFKNIRNLTPGTYLTVDKEGDMHEVIFYDINREGSSTLPALEAQKMIQDALIRSVKSQMMSDVKLGCQLSGGVDSSLVTSYAADFVQEGKLETISITFYDPRFSEEKYIDQVASKFALMAHKYTMEPDYYFDTLDKAIWHFEQPLNHPNSIGIYLLSEQAKKHVTVLLSGEGADETMAGYSRFIHLNGPLLGKNFLGGLKKNRKNPIEYLAYYFNSEDRVIMSSSYSNLETAKALLPSFKLKSALMERRVILKKLQGNAILRQQKYELQSYLPDLLMRQDKMSMAHSIENRVPFLDNYFVSQALKVPADQLIHNKNNKKEAKYLLKEICAQRFDEAFAYRNKMGFGIPLKGFMSSEGFVKKWKEDIEPGIAKRGLFSTTEMTKWMDNIQKASPYQLDGIWLMVNFEIWARQYLDS